MNFFTNYRKWELRYSNSGRKNRVSRSYHGSCPIRQVICKQLIYLRMYNSFSIKKKLVNVSVLSFGGVLK